MRKKRWEEESKKNQQRLFLPISLSPLFLSSPSAFPALTLADFGVTAADVGPAPGDISLKVTAAAEERALRTSFPFP
jgi:hypothetical protein